MECRRWFADWSAAAHSLKGTARGVGAFPLAEACERAETLVGDASGPVARSLAAQEIREQIYKVDASIDQFHLRAVRHGATLAERFRLCVLAQRIPYDEFMRD